MILSFILVLVLGFLFGYLFSKIKLPKIIGMIFIGVVLGYFSLLDSSFLELSSILRKIALIVILTRAGLSIDISQIKENGITAILMCFIPALFEIFATTIFAPLLLPISYLEALLLGSVLAAVSPAIIVPRMIKYKSEYQSKAPNLMLAGSSVDDIFVLLVFYSVLGLFINESNNLINIPITIILGVVVGCVIGYLLKKFFKNSGKSIIIVITTFSISIILILLENLFNFNSLISIIIIGMFLIDTKEIKNIKNHYNKIWVIFEIILFVLVGVTVNLDVALMYGLQAILLILIILLFRTIGVICCLIKIDFTIREKIFCVISYLPKATVQASIGAIALENNLESGAIILSIAVVSILVTAPLGAILLDNTSTCLLRKKEKI